MHVHGSIIPHSFLLDDECLVVPPFITDLPSTAQIMGLGDMDVLTRLREVVRGSRGPRYQSVGSEGATTTWKDRGLSRAKYLILGGLTIVVLAVILLVVSVIFFHILLCLAENSTRCRKNM